MKAYIHVWYGYSTKDENIIKGTPSTKGRVQLHLLEDYSHQVVVKLIV